MDKLSALSRGTQIMLGAGVLLLIVSFFDWWSEDVGPITVGQSAWQGWGLLMCIALLALLAWLAARIAGFEIPLPISETMVVVVLAALILLFAVLENLTSDFSNTVMSFVGMLLAAAIAAGAWMELQDAGGMDTLRTEMDTMRTRPATESTAPGTTPTTTTPDSTPPPPPPAQTSPPPPTQTSPPPPPPPPTPTSPPPSEPPPASTDPTH